METTIQGLGFGVKGPRKQIVGFWGPNTMNVIVFEP